MAQRCQQLLPTRCCTQCAGQQVVAHMLEAGYPQSIWELMVILKRLVVVIILVMTVVIIFIKSNCSAQTFCPIILNLLHVQSPGFLQLELCTYLKCWQVVAIAKHKSQSVSGLKGLKANQSVVIIS